MEDEMGMTECLNCGAAGRVIDGSMCPACDGAGKIEDDYTPTQLDRVEAKLDQVLAHIIAKQPSRQQTIMQCVEENKREIMRADSRYR